MRQPTMSLSRQVVVKPRRMQSEAMDGQNVNPLQEDSYEAVFNMFQQYDMHG